MPAEKRGPHIEIVPGDITPAVTAAGVAVLKAFYGPRADQNDGNIASDVFLAMLRAMNEAG